MYDQNNNGTFSCFYWMHWKSAWKSMWTFIYHWLVQIFLLEQVCTNSPFCTISVHKTTSVQQYSGIVWCESLSRGQAKASQSGPHLNSVLGPSESGFSSAKVVFVDFLLFFGSLSCCITQIKCRHLCRTSTCREAELNSAELSLFIYLTVGWW